MRGKLKQVGLVVTGLVCGILLSLNMSAVADRSSIDLPAAELRTFAEVLNAVKRGYVEDVADSDLIEKAISGMLEGLDPHSAYLNPDEWKDLRVGTSGQFGGLGIEVGMDGGFVKVVSPIEDTPAFRGGIKPGDLIIKIDQTAVKGLNLSDAVKLMRGKPDTDITLLIVRNNEARPLEIKLRREIIKVQSVKAKMIEPGYAHIRITQFQENTTRYLADQLLLLSKQAPLKGVVLDLRNDPGGLLNNAIGVSAAFLPKDVLVVSTDGRHADAHQEYRARVQDYQSGGEDALRKMPAVVKTVPMVVLINGGSASASEIVAGALQDHQRALVMGTQSFGKGSVQTVLPLNNGGAIKLTTARYFTPKGRSIQATGIEPDKLVEEVVGQKDDLRVREADLARHLSNPTERDKEDIAAARAIVGKQLGEEDAAAATGAVTPVAEPKRFDPGSKDDRQFVTALKFLKGESIDQFVEKKAVAPVTTRTQ